MNGRRRSGASGSRPSASSKRAASKPPGSRWRLQPPTAAQVATTIAEISGVTKAEDVTGPYDVIVRAEAKNVDELGKLVVARIQAVEGITRTLTCPVVHL